MQRIFSEYFFPVCITFGQTFLDHSTFKNSCSPTCLHLSQRVDCSKAVNEAHYCQCGPGERRREYMFVETQPIATVSLNFGRQERETVVVTSGEYHGVHL